MEQLQIITQTDLDTIPKVINWNYEELKSALRSQLEVYKNLVVSPDAIKSAKSDRAKLNKLATAVEEYRKDVKRRCLEPYNALEANCKELVSIIKEPMSAIDEQVKVFEDKEKKDKYDELKAHFEKKVGDEDIDFELILNPKWANKTLKTEELKGEIEDHIDRVKEEIVKLTEQYGTAPYYVAIMNKYKEAYNFSQAVVLATTLKFEHDREQEKKQKAAALQGAADQPAPEQVDAAPQAAPANEPVLKGSFYIEATKSQIIELREFMKNKGISFKAIRN